MGWGLAWNAQLAFWTWAGRCMVEVLGEDKAGRRWSHVVAQNLSLSVGGQPSLSPGGGAQAAGLGACLFLQFLLS